MRNHKIFTPRLISFLRVIPLIGAFFFLFTFFFYAKVSCTDSNGDKIKISLDYKPMNGRKKWRVRSIDEQGVRSVRYSGSHDKALKAFEDFRADCVK